MYPTGRLSFSSVSVLRLFFDADEEDYSGNKKPSYRPHHEAHYIMLDFTIQTAFEFGQGFLPLFLFIFIWWWIVVFYLLPSKCGVGKDTKLGVVKLELPNLVASVAQLPGVKGTEDYGQARNRSESKLECFLSCVCLRFAL